MLCVCHSFILQLYIYIYEGWRLCRRPQIKSSFRKQRLFMSFETIWGIRGFMYIVLSHSFETPRHCTRYCYFSVLAWVKYFWYLWHLFGNVLAYVKHCFRRLLGWRVLKPPKIEVRIGRKSYKITGLGYLGEGWGAFSDLGDFWRGFLSPRWAQNEQSWRQVGCKRLTGVS